MLRWSRLQSCSVTRRRTRVRWGLLLNTLEDRCVPATITVTDPGNSVAVNSKVTLVEAINSINGAANTNADVVAVGAYGANDSILFDGAVFATSKTISQATQFTLSKSVTITGPGSGLLTLSNTGAASATARLFSITASPVTITGMTMTGGNETAVGGAITFTSQIVNLTDVVITGNKTTANFGGGVYFTTGTLNANNVVVSANQAIGSFGGGGGIFVSNGLGVAGTLNFTDSTASGNSSSNSGGGLSITNGILNMTRSTISGNSSNVLTAGNGGGGIYLFGATATIINSTISGNNSATKASPGGGLVSRSTGTVTIRNSTIAFNDGGASNGGGVRRLDTATFTIESTIISDNTATTAPDINGLVDTMSNCIVKNSTGLSITTSSGNQLGVDPLLVATLTNANGGTTMYHTLQLSSPAFNKGSNSTSQLTDQRGPGFARNQGAAVDVGSFEASLVVNATNDETIDTDGKTSLREALAISNAGAGVDTITFNATVFATAKTITLSLGELLMSDSVVIVGPAARATVNANDLSRVLNLGVAGTGNVSVSNLILTNGKSAGGAGILANDDNLTLTNCTVSNNSSTGDGGGIGTVGAAGIWTLSDSTFSGNSGVTGGALDFVSTGTLLMTGCTVSGNTASGGNGGGGLSNVNGNSTIINSTFNDNHATGWSGGAILLAASSGTVTIQNSTISGNDALTTGGGIRVNAGMLSLESTIVAKNVAPMSGDDVSGAVSYAKFNLIGESDGSTGITDPSNLTGTKASPLDAKLGPLANNGGPTWTQSPLAGSPCVDAGNNPTALATDQRGPGFPRQLGAGIDIGAFEFRANIVVNTAADSGVGSLRQAILNANAIPGADTITFDPVFFATAKTITLTGGELLIADPVTITGPGAALATIHGNDTHRVFDLNGPGTIDVFLSGLTITHGKTTGGAFGAGILNQAENLTLTNSVVSNNSADGAGGGVSNYGGGMLVVDHCTISGNQSNFNGGGLDGNSFAFITVRDSAITNNQAKNVGGGISCGSDQMLIERSTVSGNTAPIVGGIVLNCYTPAGVLTLRNATVSNNTATLSNAGGLSIGGPGSMLVVNSTVTGNSTAGQGGGIGYCSKIMLESSIVQGNTASFGAEFYTTGTVSAKNAALGSTTGITTFTNLGGNLIGTNIKLGPLADNGGLTKTHALLAGSPCVNAGSNPASLTVDQRGNIRSAGQTDIGAFEVQSPAKFSSVVINGGDAQRSMVTKVAVNFNQHIGFTGGAAAAFTLNRVSPTPGSVTLAAVVDDSGSGTAVTLSFTGGAVNGASLADGRYALHILASGFNAEGFDGNNNGTAQGSPADDYFYDEPASPTALDAARIFRIFGDANGDGAVAANDFVGFRGAFGAVLTPTNYFFDFDGDGAVAANDFIEFRSRFNSSI